MIHSDLPWSMCGEGECRCGSIFAGDGEVQVGCLYGPDDIGRGVVPNAEARRGNAALLFKAVNLHNELVAALEGFVHLLDGQTLPLHPISWQVELQHAKVALAKAKGE